MPGSVEEIIANAKAKAQANLASGNISTKPSSSNPFGTSTSTTIADDRAGSGNFGAIESNNP